MSFLKKYYFIVLLFTVCFSACNKDDDDQPPVEPVVLDSTPYELNYGNFPAPNLPADNPLTIQGVQLGKMLFYEKMLSKDLSQACADCHKQADGFSDVRTFSIGVEGFPGFRHAMSVFNMAWNTNGFFWDGRAEQLRDQALLPIQDTLEMNETLESVILKLEANQNYKDQFTRVFGSDEITSEKMALALEQFMLTIVSNDSKFDKSQREEVMLTESEERGRELFFAEYNPFFPNISGADCVHCHGGINFENDQYMNNGLDTDLEFVDPGRESVTNEPSDRAKFKVPSLRNIELTAPYMHDGRFATLEEVVDHYNEGIKISSTVNAAIAYTAQSGLLLTPQDKTDLVNFLKTLTDYTFIQNEEYASPF